MTIKLLLVPVAGLITTLFACQQGGESWSTRDEIKLSSSRKEPAGPPRGAPTQLSAHPSQLVDGAVDLLLTAAQADHPQLRHHALEALQPLPQTVAPLARQGLVDPNRAVRFAAVMTIGQLKLSEHAHLLEPLLQDESPSVQAAAIYALRRCGRKVNLNPLAAMIKSPDAEVRGNAAMVLGEIGDPSAAKLIQQAIGQRSARVPAARGKIVELQMAAALVKLGDDENLKVIRAALFAPEEQSEIAALACLLCGELGDASAIADLHNLTDPTEGFQRQPEVRMAATQAMAMLDPRRAPLEVPSMYAVDEAPERRSQAATTLGVIGDPAALATLQAMMSDPDPLVQVAAAGAILKIAAK
jgi:HEAT repeat protein